MVAIFVVMTIVAAVLIDVFIVQKIEAKRERKRAVFYSPEVGVTITDGGKERKEKKEEKK